ncbi:MAG: amino acid--tRNA ligase-related protein, partial [Candidatus Fermentibacter daniensis]
MTERNDQIEQRLAKLAGIRDDLGLDPYPPRTGPVTPVARVVESGETQEPVSTAGRIRARREHGKTVFMDVWSEGASIQVYLKKDRLPEAVWRLSELLDLGDIVRVTGPVFRTRSGELTVQVASLELLCKSLRPLPVVKTDSEGRTFDAFADTEMMYRHRSIDLAVNPESRERALARSRIITALRAYLDRNRFVEVETPVLQPLYGGAAAEPFKTEYAHLGETFYLRIATELYLKRLLAGGMDRVYELGKDFRNEGIDSTHSPEFTQLELYEAYGDYGTMMTRFEEMMQEAAQAAGCGRTASFRGHAISLEAPFARVGFVDALREASGEDFFSWEPGALRRLCDDLGIAPGSSSREDMIDRLFD